MIKNDAMFKLSYGLFILSAHENEKDNACIINTACQVTSEPKQITIAVNKNNYTCGMIERTKKFTISVLSTEATFDLIKRFGFASGKDSNKFEGFKDHYATENGTHFVCVGTNAYISCTVTSVVDCGTHLLFVSEVTETETLSDEPSATYQYYFDHIKPKAEQPKKKGYVCKICGYVYEGDELPDDFTCPLCKHGAEDFEKIG